MACASCLPAEMSNGMAQPEGVCEREQRGVCGERVGQARSSTHTPPVAHLPCSLLPCRQPAGRWASIILEMWSQGPEISLPRRWLHSRGTERTERRPSWFRLISLANGGTGEKERGEGG